MIEHDFTQKTVCFYLFRPVTFPSFAMLKSCLDTGSSVNRQNINEMINLIKVLLANFLEKKKICEKQIYANTWIHWAFIQALYCITQTFDFQRKSVRNRFKPTLEFTEHLSNLNIWFPIITGLYHINFN